MNHAVLPAQSDGLLPVEALRAIAALSVVSRHAIDQRGMRGSPHQPDNTWTKGSAGIGRFFITSGLVMTISFWCQADRLGAARIFLRQRAIALQPFLAPRLPGRPLALGYDAYAIFLIHGFVVPVAYVVALYAGLAGGSLLLGALVTALVASALVNQLTHTYGERSAMFLLRRRSRFQFVAVAD